MRFSTIIKRQTVDIPGKVTIGSDTIDPHKVKQFVTPFGGVATDAGTGETTCEHVSRLTNINGFPVQRLAIGYMPPAGNSAGLVTISCYVLDDTSGLWFKTPVSSDPTSYVATPEVGALVYFDTPALPDFVDVHHNDPGKIKAFFLIGTAGTFDVDGEVLFPVASDISSPGV